MPVPEQLTIELDVCPYYSIALCKNGVSPVRSLAIVNAGSLDLTGLTLQIEAEPAFFAPVASLLTRIPSQCRLDPGPIRFAADADFLGSLTEGLTARLTVTAIAADGSRLQSATAETRLLAFDEWTGLGAAPELLCAFLDSDSAIVRDTVQAVPGLSTLREAEFSDPEAIRRQAGAIAAGLRKLGIRLNDRQEEPAAAGRRIVSADLMVERGEGTRLDLALLFAAALDAAGLNALIVLDRRAVLAGFWLENRCFGEPVQDDGLLVQALARQTDGGLVLFDPIMLTDSVHTFDEACRQGSDGFEPADDFILLIDVRRSRLQGIVPLRALATPDGYGSAPEEVKPATRLRQWERKLLDLSLRNPLLNFRPVRSSVSLLTARLPELEDRLARGVDLQVLPAPTGWQPGTPDERQRELLLSELSQNKLHAALPDAELEASLTALFRSARSSLEENGANTLYLALGFLQWYEDAGGVQPRRAPLLLVPVEIRRLSARKGYVVRGRDEETSFNVTLLEMLRQDFALTIPGLDPLPGDENGTDLAAVLAFVRKAVAGQPRWTVLEEACLGIFSFSQFIMWNDLHNRTSDLARSQVVASMLAGSLTWQPDPLPSAQADLDDLCPPGTLFLPVSADASQQAAVLAASQGHSFVLHGPPGTGKSQTITNLIGNALAQGQTVLFVAEKRAALEVVQRRLEQIGLGPFCLEIHSNKSRKGDVLEQLRRTVELAAVRPPEAFAREARHLAGLRADLQVYVRHLYKVHPFGISLADAIARCGELSCAREGIALPSALFDELDQEKAGRLFEQAGELAAAAAGCGGPYRHPLTDLQAASWSVTLKRDAAKLLQELAAAASAADICFNRLQDSLMLGQLLSPSRLEAPAAARRVGRRLRAEMGLLTRICRLATDLPALPPALLALPPALLALPPALLAVEDPALLSARLKSLFSQGRQLTAIRSEALQVFTEAAAQQPGSSLLAAWQASALQWNLPKMLERRRIRQALKPALLPDVQLSDNQFSDALQLLVSWQEAEHRTVQELEPLKHQLGAFWADQETDWEAGIRFAESLPEIDQAAVALTGLASAGARLRAVIADRFVQPEFKVMLAETTAAAESVTAIEEQLTSLLGIRFDELDDDPEVAGWPENWFAWLQPRVSGWSSALEGLREWCSWLNVRDKAADHGLAALTDAIGQGAVAPAEVADSFARAYYQAAADWIICREPALNAFAGQVFEEKIRQFKAVDEQFTQLTRQEIAARLAARLPQYDPASGQDKEIGLLLRAIRSGGRGLSIRRLFEQLPSLLPRLAPCMLMSPISVAQYLDPGQKMFDLVVFDEASQMPASEAAGAMARGRSVVIVGDPNQLPPTSFFNVSVTDEENLESEDLESVLDDCLALPLPQMHLLWHYRSRHESLIAFSNRQYYENRLLTFPSPNDRISKVSLVKVDGVYDRGRSKQNVAEARAVVAEVLRRLETSAQQAESLGIVTFSSVQQNLIEDLLTDVFRDRPDIETRALQGLEPLFVKNLENVQGDERDVILFSVGYGPDASGRVSLNFGPLNREGGWRRLNVAVSRARSEMMVFSTIGPEQLDVTRTSATGVSGLRAFLDYARRGSQPMAVRDAAQSHAGLAAQLAAALEEAGYQTQQMVGRSGYRIDIGIVHPKREGEYILGILCNGTAYRDARTTRDREILQRAVLEQLGWHLHQVWAVDWLENPAREVRRILQRLETLIGG